MGQIQSVDPPDPYAEFNKPSATIPVNAAKGAQDARKALITYWETQGALAILPPAVGYLILFAILPWIGRGFRSTHL